MTEQPMTLIEQLENPPRIAGGHLDEGQTVDLMRTAAFALSTMIGVASKASAKSGKIACACLRPGGDPLGNCEECNPSHGVAQTPSALEAAIRSIIVANNDFRAGMPEEWDGDPLQDAINEAAKLLLPSALTARVEPVAAKPVAFTNENQLLFLLAYPEIPFAMWANESPKSPIPLYAAPPAETMRTWQPIETAPKDGTRVWIYVPEFEPNEYVAEFGSTADLPKDHEDYWEGWVFADEILINHCSDELEPTHWMPLPFPPDAGERG